MATRRDLEQTLVRPFISFSSHFSDFAVASLQYGKDFCCMPSKSAPEILSAF